jgi:DNA-binding transcriptional MerR regulator
VNPQQREEGVRPTELARRAGVSTQHVRNLEATGVLPAAERTSSGYRRLGPEHLSALLAYQALAAGHGPALARAIMLAVGRGDPAQAFALIDASHAGLDEQRRTLDQTGHTLNAVVAQGHQPAVAGGLRVGELARRLGVRPSALRVWEGAGLLTPARERGTHYRTYTADDVRDARVIHVLRQGGYLFDRIRPVIEGIRGTGSTDALRAAVEERQAALTARAEAMLAGAAHLHAHLSGGFVAPGVAVP